MRAFSVFVFHRQNEPDSVFPGGTYMLGNFIIFYRTGKIRQDRKHENVLFLDNFLTVVQIYIVSIYKYDADDI